jgi:hypothetical protein
MSKQNEYFSPESKAPADLGDNNSATADTRQPCKICLILNEGVVAWLDSLANRKGCELNRSSVTRAIITAFSKRGIRFSGARTEPDIVEMVGRALDIALNSRAPSKAASPKPAAPAARAPQATPSTQAVNGKGTGANKRGRDCRAVGRQPRRCLRTVHARARPYAPIATGR